MSRRFNPRAPKELWAYEQPQLVPGISFPLYIWRATNQWECAPRSLAIPSLRHG